MALYKLYARRVIRMHVFSQKVIDEWNNLPSDVIDSKSVIEFKRRTKPLFAEVRKLYISRRRLPAPILKTSGGVQ